MGLAVVFLRKWAQKVKKSYQKVRLIQIKAVFLYQKKIAYVDY